MDSYGKRVIARIKNEGLADLGEEALKKLWSALCEELTVEVTSNNKSWDDFAVAPIEAVKGLGLKMLDKVDGREG